MFCIENHQRTIMFYIKHIHINSQVFEYKLLKTKSRPQEDTPTKAKKTCQIQYEYASTKTVLIQRVRC
mgnify:CR=1 FL=1